MYHLVVSSSVYGQILNRNRRFVFVNSRRFSIKLLREAMAEYKKNMPCVKPVCSDRFLVMLCMSTKTPDKHCTCVCEFIKGEPINETIPKKHPRVGIFVIVQVLDIVGEKKSKKIKPHDPVLSQMEQLKQQAFMNVFEKYPDEKEVEK